MFVWWHWRWVKLNWPPLMIRSRLVESIKVLVVSTIWLRAFVLWGYQQTLKALLIHGKWQWWMSKTQPEGNTSDRKGGQHYHNNAGQQWQHATMLSTIPGREIKIKERKRKRKPITYSPSFEFWTPNAQPPQQHARWHKRLKWVTINLFFIIIG